MFKGLDLSVYQSKVDYDKLKEQGIEFAIIRCGYGKDNAQKDGMFEKHYEGLKRVGIKVGCYHYSYCNSVDNAILEAENCLDLIKGKDFDLPIFIDLEENRTAILGKDNCTKIAKIFCDRIKQAGYNAGVYANLDWFHNKLNVKELEKDYYIWLAQWTERHTADFKVDFWQYTNKGQILGIPNNVDLNYQYTEINKNSDSKPDIVIDTKFEINQTYTLQVDLNVRAGAGTDNRIKNYNELTANGKEHAYNQENAVLKEGTRVTCLEVIKVGNDEWIRIPSGYIAGYYDDKYYVK